jgi:hypothetical protein
MRRRVGFLAFLIYVSLDLSNPLMAGAFNFNPEECVEAMHAGSQRLHAPSVVTMPTALDDQRVMDRESLLVRRRLAARERAGEWLVPRRVAPAPSHHPPSPAEDH